MAAPNILRGTYVTVLVQTAVGPPAVFSVLCGITTKSFDSTVNTSDTYNRDCADPEDVPDRRISATGKLHTLTGSGNMNRDQKTILDGLLGVTQKYRYFIARKAGEVAPVPNGYYGGDGMLTRRRILGDDGTYIGVDLTIESDGDWPWTDVA